jgi:exonuclease III
MRIRIATWNLNHRRKDTQQRAWDYLATTVKADIAIGQETTPPEHYPHAGFAELDSDPRSRMKWGSLVVSLNPGIQLREIPKRVWEAGAKADGGGFVATHLGAAAAVEADLGDGKILKVVGIYGQLERLSNNTTYAVTSMHRILSDLTPLLDYKRGTLLVAGGDLNCSTQIEKRYRRWHKTLFQRIEDFGLHDCMAANKPPRAPLKSCFCDERGDCRHVQTFRNHGAEDSRPWQIDYLFASDMMFSGLVECHAWNHPDAWILSDHCPVVAEFEA